MYIYFKTRYYDTEDPWSEDDSDEDDKDASDASENEEMEEENEDEEVDVSFRKHFSILTILFFV